MDSIKAAQVLRENKAISKDIILMVDEMYLRKKVQYSGGEYVGADKDGNLYKGIVVFMVCGLKKTLPIVVKASPETKLNGTWMSEQLEECVCTLAEAGFKVRAIVTDNHSANVAAFSMLRKKFPGGGFFFQHPRKSTKIYLFFDNVHLIKNVRNNLLNCHKFVFPSFSFQIKNKIVASSDAGFISWSDMKSLLNRDVKLEANLRKASKLSFEALHPGHSPVALQLRAPPKVSARAPAHRSYHFRGVKLKSCIKKIHHNLYISKQANVRIKHADTEGASHKKFGTDARVQ